ncbi:uncharacterized protein N7483_003840 [Penicillium malachiteum]|uniref:uncharacterized protein n=1 Tax=Penicillium malachiteum TaxID=1324776 RepID=UPI0025487EFC|nr:uncharacterized protein N7483_003840 [Penicillium malachiteum]KAJ5729332.1 hypothetical protein N7483_003840 [Penicillium malachiteum]
MSPSSGALVHTLSHNWLGKADLAVQSVLLTGGVIAVALRLWSRRLLGVSWEWTDWLVLVALIVALGRYIAELLLVLLCGLGLHTEDVAKLGGDDILIRFRKITFAGELLWITALALIQLSILHYYLRQFQHRIIVLLTYTTIGICSAFWIGSFFATTFSCTPVKKAWLSDTAGHCGNTKQLHLSSTVSEGIVEAFILCLPIPILFHSQLPTPRKVAVGGIYLLGFIIIATTLIRIKTYSELNINDTLYTSARNSLLSCVVPLLGVIVACLPIIPPAIHRIFGTAIFLSPSDSMTTYGYRASGYYKTTVLSGTQMEEPEIPLVSVRQPPMAKKLSEWCHGQIKITSDWEIHSTRNSARMDKDSIRRA